MVVITRELKVNCFCLVGDLIESYIILYFIYMLPSEDLLL